jgi:hypothetical protein
MTELQDLDIKSKDEKRKKRKKGIEGNTLNG